MNMAATRYLIGQGEKLSEEIARPPRGMGDKAHPYAFPYAQRRLAPQWRRASDTLRGLPSLACPGGEAAIELTLHPSYLAKSYYPGHLLRELGLFHLGSRAVHVVPDSVVSSRALESGQAQPAPVLYLGGEIDRLIAFGDQIDEWMPDDERVQDDFRKIESIATPSNSRLKTLSERFADRDEIPMEVVLHSPDVPGKNHYVVLAFQEFLESLGISCDIGRARHAGGLAFLPLRAPREQLDAILAFTFLRALREAPRILPFDPMMRSIGSAFTVPLPADNAATADLSVAIFDGGLPANHGLDRWVTLHDAPGVGAPTADGQRHGLAVTSAFLFGPLTQGQPTPLPYANVDHWRVYGEGDDNDFEAFAMLDRIEDVLTSRRYDFINISLGPSYAIDDDDVSPWTARLDQLLAGGDTVATIACGNNGAADQATGLHRIQPPSDGVNVLGVGASDGFMAGWQRAPYSAWGPGRSPGYVKPDFVSFGGCHGQPFLALSEVSPPRAQGTMGTSFAAPIAMRSGTGIRAQFTDGLWAPAIKALLVHHAAGDLAKRPEIGWGLLSHGLGDLVLCDDYEAHIVYQRQMPTTGAVRLYLPIPPGLTGNVEIKATFSFYCDVDPEDAINYTRGGLDIQFRPDTTRIPPPYEKDGKLITPTVPASESFFSAKNFYATEHMQRDDAQKWETTLTRTKTKRASSLVQPAFDVSYIARENGHIGGRPSNMKFALVLTLRNKSARDLYDRVIVSSANRLQPMRPRVGVQVPLRLRVS
ncbi:S8 family peptidase [Nitrospirillum sp. BR 11164]|uniref:S8 family peptidase n=1 Tax=Nitrospirillum sp. BR 11164 TaxID=3104324 RepID=UPI002AFFA4EA|nr:S8 family peptidase [Nitrospirillum sp. BR 11164]MEA1649856.1 S8 family peptidase [Nitrospirillum sp. BR 11164]